MCYLFSILLLFYHKICYNAVVNIKIQRKEKVVGKEPNIRVMLFDEDGERFFGEGPCRLLHAIEQTGSLRAAAQSMQMAYTKALGLVRHAEQVLGFALTERKIGGKGGGGSVLTDEAKEFLYRYEQYRDACKQAGKQLYPQFFPDEK